MTTTSKAELSPALDSGSAIARTARKPHRCTCADEQVNGRPNRNYPSRQPDCLGDIKPGDLYVEYLGEAAAYESGTPYCVPCGLATWGKPAALPPARPLKPWMALAAGQVEFFRNRPELNAWVREHRNFGDVTIRRWRDGQYRGHSVIDWWCVSCHRVLDQSMADNAHCPGCGGEYAIERTG